MSQPTRVESRAWSLVDRAWPLLLGAEDGRRATGGVLPVRDPSSDAQMAEVPCAGPEEVAVAVESASAEVRLGWGRAPPARRAAVLRRAADLIEDRREHLALVEALDCGRPIARALGQDVPMAVATLRYQAREAERLVGRTVEAAMSPARARVDLEPIGVVAALTPWNLPLLLASWTIAPALACGCAVVHKPSEHTPLSALLLGEWLREAGVPPGAISVLAGRGRHAGAALASHPLVDQVDFTGSVAAGRAVAAAAGAQLARVALELGGKNPILVLDDADPARAASVAAHAAFANAGQACSAGSRLLVQRGVRDHLVQALVAIAETLRVGHALDERTQVGPLISAEHRGRVRGHVDDALARGATLAAGGTPWTGAQHGHFMRPTILLEPPPAATCLGEEVFGPVVTVQTVGDDEQAVAMANDTPYGLTAGVLGRDRRRCERVASRLRAGTVWIDGWHRYDPAVPFPARGRSGTGVHNGREALLAHTRPRVTWAPDGP